MRLRFSMTSAFLALVFILALVSVPVCPALAQSPSASQPKSGKQPPAADSNSESSPAPEDSEVYPANAVVKESVTDVRTGEEIKKASGRLRLSTALIVGETSYSSYDRAVSSALNSDDKVESKRRHSLSGVQFAVKYEPNEVLGTTWEFGLNFQGHVHVNTLELSGRAGDVTLPLQNFYGTVGYKVWRFGGAIGLQYPLFPSVTYQDYDVSSQIGFRVALSADIAPNFSIGGYVGWMGYRFKPDSDFARTVSVDVGSSGFLLRCTTP